MLKFHSFLNFQTANKQRRHFEKLPFNPFQKSRVRIDSIEFSPGYFLDTQTPKHIPHEKTRNTHTKSATKPSNILFIKKIPITGSIQHATPCKSHTPPAKTTHLKFHSTPFQRRSFAAHCPELLLRLSERESLLRGRAVAARAADELGAHVCIYLHVAFEGGARARPSRISRSSPIQSVLSQLFSPVDVWESRHVGFPPFYNKSLMGFRLFLAVGKM